MISCNYILHSIIQKCIHPPTTTWGNHIELIPKLTFWLSQSHTKKKTHKKSNNPTTEVSHYQHYAAAKVRAPEWARLLWVTMTCDVCAEQGVWVWVNVFTSCRLNFTLCTDWVILQLKSWRGREKMATNSWFQGCDCHGAPTAVTSHF